MAKKSDSEDFIDVSIGEMRLRIPNDFESVDMAKKHIDALHKSFPKEILPQPECEAEIVNISTEVPTETIEDLPTPSPKQLPIIEEEKEVKIAPSEESFTVCPLCSGKLKRKKIKQKGDEVRQTVLCKKRGCKFKREYVFNL